MSQGVGATGATGPTGPPGRAGAVSVSETRVRLELLARVVCVLAAGVLGWIFLSDVFPK